jgi:hypothetical protein
MSADDVEFDEMLNREVHLQVDSMEELTDTEVP